MPLRCLLIGPAEEGEQATGEDTYVRSLLQHPPAGVEYVHYSRLLAEGKGHRQRWVHALFSRLARYGYLRPAPWLETFRTDEEFDLIHLHGFDVRLEGKVGHSPVVLGTSSHGPTHCDDYLGWPRHRIVRYHRRLRRLFRLLGIYDACNNLRNCRRVLVWSEYARGLHLRAGTRRERVVVIPPGVEVPPRPFRQPGEKPVVLFVGRDFCRKGGDVLLEAWRKLPSGAARLVLIGGNGEALPEGVEHYPYVSAFALKHYFYPRAQIFVFPTLAEGYGMVVLEAMAYGLSVAASQVGAIPEIVADGESGFLVPPGDVEALAGRLEELISDSRLCREMGIAGRQRALALFSLERRNALLAEVYRGVVEGNPIVWCHRGA